MDEEWGLGGGMVDHVALKTVGGFGEKGDALSDD